MIKAELSHNPYLLITKAAFNGQAPRINSQIEKYYKLPLRDWVHKVPEIFYDEMNGYDFEFYFTGTAADYIEITKAFRRNGADRDKVRLFHRNEIENPDIKSEEIDALIKWMRQNPNRKFNFEHFWKVNSEIFENSYPYIIIGGNLPNGSNDIKGCISPETVESAKELLNTNLTNTAIMFCIQEKTIEEFRDDLITILDRNDIRQEQIFFIIESTINVDMVTRVISDLGLKNPQVVERYDAPPVLRYIRDYQVADYVQTAIKVFDEVANKIDKAIDEGNTTSEKSNADTLQRIAELDAEIEKLKITDEVFVQRDNYDVSHKFSVARKELLQQIFKWKNRKTKIIGETDANEVAADFLMYIRKTAGILETSVKEISDDAAMIICKDYSCKYSCAGIDTGFRPVEVKLNKKIGIEIPDFTDIIMKLKDITFEDGHNDFFGLFKRGTAELIQPVKVEIYYLEKWRVEAKKIILPYVDDFIHKSAMSLQAYYDSMAEAYHKHIISLISSRTKEKNKLSLRLSGEEKLLQEDNDWFADLKEQLQNIERG